MLTGVLAPIPALPASAGSIWPTPARGQTEDGDHSRERHGLFRPDCRTKYSLDGEIYGMDRSLPQKTGGEILTVPGTHRTQEMTRPHTSQRECGSGSASPAPSSPRHRCCFSTSRHGGLDVFSHRLVTGYDPQDERRGQHGLFHHAQHRGGKRALHGDQRYQQRQDRGNGQPGELKKTFDTAKYVEVAFDQLVKESG